MRLLLVGDGLMFHEAVLDLLRAESHAVGWVKRGLARASDMPINGCLNRSQWVAANLVPSFGAIDLAPSVRLPSGTAFRSMLHG